MSVDATPSFYFSPHYFAILLRAILLFLFASFLFACKSVQQSNGQFYEVRSPGQLQSDVDYVHKKLTKYHPQLYRYISKEILDYKFDSLKASITTSMPATDFYLKLSPVVAAVRQGHATLSIPYSVDEAERESIRQLGYRPWFPFKAEFLNERFYILKDSRKTTEIEPGTEIISINGLSPAEIFMKYRNSISRDGYNETLIPKKFSTMLYYYLKEHQEKTEVDYKLRYKDSVWVYSLKYQSQKPSASIPQPKTPAPLQKKKSNKPKEIKDQPVLLSRSKTRMFRFYKGDSSIAVMRIDNFDKDAYKPFYRKSFDLLTSAGTKVLILDLRDNPGGYAKDAAELYSYLTDSSIQFNRELELTSRQSLLQNYRFLSKVKSPLVKPIISTMATMASIPPSITLRKEGEGRYSYHEKSSKRIEPKANHFTGKVYVLINGGTFSAASLLASNLKGSGRAVFIGTETGGAENGCVAGFLPVLTLPYSKLSLRFGLAAVEPYYARGKEGHGIFPDIEVMPSLEDRLKGVDVELKRAIDEVKRK